MTNALTGAEALKAIAEATHEYEDDDGLTVWIEPFADVDRIFWAAPLTQQTLIDLTDVREIMRRTWTRGRQLRSHAPDSGDPQTVVLCRWRSRASETWSFWFEQGAFRSSPNESVEIQTAVVQVPA